MKDSILLRKIGGVFTACRRGFGMKLMGSSQSTGISPSLPFALALLCIPILIVLAALLALMPHAAGGLLLATAPVALTRDLKTIIGDIDRIEAEWKGKLMPQNVGEQLDGLYTEGKALQDADDRRKQRKKLEEFAREVPNPSLPAGKVDPDEIENKVEKKGAKNRIVGYMRVGDYIANQEHVQKYLQHFKQIPNVNLEVPGLLKVKSAGMRQGFVPLTKEMRDAIESKDLAVVGDGVIEPMRLTDIVRDTENDVLTMRDLLNVSPTSASRLEWVARVGDPDRSAEIQSEGPTASTMAAKPQADAEYEKRSTEVKTIAVWIPVTEQQLQDMPALINLIQEDMLWDVRKEEEEQVVWGDATGDNLDGLDKNIAAADAGGYTSLIDLIRRAVTQVRVSGYAPNGVAIHPEDWETIELEKGSDGHYIWAIIRDELGPRIWSMRVAESIAMDDPDSTDRLVIVGDWRRGATLFDRMQASIAIGWINDFFIRNLRAIRAEERVALAVRRPDAFRKIVVSAS